MFKKLQKRLTALKKSKGMLEVIKQEVTEAVENAKKRKEELVEKFGSGGGAADNTMDTATPQETATGSKRKVKCYGISQV